MAYSKGKISIPNASGNIVITVVTQQITPTSYTNQIPISTDSSGNIYESIGYKDDTRISSSKQVVSFSGAFTTGWIPVQAGDTIRVSSGLLDPSWVSAGSCNDNVVASDKATPVFSATMSTISLSNYIENVITDSNGYITQFTIKSMATKAGFIRFTFKGSGSGAVATVNEVIT